MGLLGAAMLAELQKPNASCIIGLELDFPSGTRRIATAPVSSDTLGTFEARIKSIDGPKRSLGDRRGGVVVPEMSVEWDDTDQAFAKILGSRERIANCPARLKILSANRSAGTPATGARIQPVTYYTGRLYDWTRSGDAAWTLNLRPPDMALTQNFCRKVISPSLWRYAADDVRGAVAPIAPGRHDSSGMGTRKGALPTLAVKTDANPFYQLVSWGRLMSVPHVFMGDVFQTSGYTIEYPVVGGEPYTVVSFTSAPTGDVRVDTVGYDSVGDGSGTLIDTAAGILRWLLANLIFQENTSGLWFSEASLPINGTAFDAIDAALAKQAGGQPFRASGYFDGAKTGYEYLEEWAASTRVDVVWTADGKLAPKYRKPLGTGSYVSSPVFTYPADMQPIEPAYPAQDWVKRVATKYGAQQSGGYIDSIEVSDPLIEVESAEPLELSTGPAFV